MDKVDKPTHENYTCDGCREPFTRDEWDTRETPHEVYCPNYDGEDTHVECDCDRNYHEQCYDADNDGLDMLFARENEELLEDADSLKDMLDKGDTDE